jgi:hypothetical protein
VIEFAVDVVEPLRESAKFTASVIFQLGLEKLECAVGADNRLTNGSEINAQGDCSRENWELGDRVEGSCFFACAVKFPLEIELNYFHIAQGHAEALVKKVVFNEVQCFPTNSTMQSGMCVKPEKSFALTRPVGLWSPRMLLKDEKGMLWVERVGICSS